MTSIEAIEGDTIGFSQTPIFETEREEETSSPALPESSLGAVHMREQEVLHRALSPHLRGLDNQVSVSELMKRIDRLIEEMSKPYTISNTYFMCVEMLAPTHPKIAANFIEKITGAETKSAALCILSNYQEGIEAQISLKSAASHFQNATYTPLSYLDKYLPNDPEKVEVFYTHLLDHYKDVMDLWYINTKDLIKYVELNERLHL